MSLTISSWNETQRLKEKEERTKMNKKEKIYSYNKSSLILSQT